MDIEEWRPEPRPSLPFNPPRKDRTALIASLLLAGTFIGTLVVMDWRQLTGKAGHVEATIQPSRGNLVDPSSTARQTAQPVTEVSVQTAPPPIVIAGPPAQ
jgi:hypothetical protein